MRNRNKAVSILVLPLALFFWVIGWVFYWLGSPKKNSAKDKVKNVAQLKFAVLVPEQKCAT
jgi:uncharacterized membrane protein